MMTTTCVVQARMGSTRLPGKILADLGGLPALVLLLRRLRLVSQSVVDVVVVATSSDPRDDVVEDLARAEGVAVVRGSEVDVLARFGAALDAYPAEHLVRITADCPFTDPEVVTLCVKEAHKTDAEYTSNTLIRTFPDGLDVEVVTAAAVRAAIAEAADPIEREHVTPFVYRHPERFSLHAVTNDELVGSERWTLDTEDDLAWLRTIVDLVRDPVGSSWRDILEVAGRRGSPRAGELWLQPDLERPLCDGRGWTVVRDAHVLGRLTVRAAGHGRGHLLMEDVPSWLRADVRQLLDRALAADWQVRLLEDDAV